MYLLPFLLFLVLWPGPTLGCDTGVAFAGQSLSLYRSSLANADVALLKSFSATDVNSCLNDCCTEKYGSCSVASFKTNSTAGDGDNCQLFNCRPVQLCKFVSSNSTDSFSFSSSTLPRVLVPSSSPPPPRKHASSDNSSTITTTSVTTGVDEPIALKNDNTTVKPRKGVGLEDIFDKPSGVKPRKGVSGDGESGTKSKVKPRKGVGPQPTSVNLASSERNESRPTQKVNQDVVADELASALERVFEDDVRDRQQLVTSSKELPVDHPTRTTAVVTSIRPSSTSVDYREVTPTSLTTLLSPSVVAETTASDLLLPSLTTTRLVGTTSLVATSSVQTPELQTVRVGPAVTHSSPTILEHSRLIFQEGSKPDSAESESERKYKSSMHLVLSLVFGLLILVSVLGVVAKRIYDSWMRRHYRRMDFLIDGMYNGYG